MSAVHFCHDLPLNILKVRADQYLWEREGEKKREETTIVRVREKGKDEIHN